MYEKGHDLAICVRNNGKFFDKRASITFLKEVNWVLCFEVYCTQSEIWWITIMMDDKGMAKGKQKEHSWIRKGNYTFEPQALKHGNGSKH